MQKFLFLLFSGLLATSLLAEESQLTGDISQSALKSAEGFNLNVCRPKSIIRFLEAPDLSVNKTKVAEIKNGTESKLSLKNGDFYEVGVTKNILLYRFRDEMLLEEQVLDATDRYVLVEAQTNWAQGATVLFSGGLGEAVRQNTKTGESGAWRLRVVTKAEYVEECKIN